MSIKSDKWFDRMCRPPDGEYIPDGSLQAGASHEVTFQYEQWVMRSSGCPIAASAVAHITVFSDLFKSQLDFKPMIEPFSPVQNKIDAAGNKLISWGCSSYGYDLRIADKFKIFTNINSTVVDPKNFDERAFVDFQGPLCIIPPNSFVLASSMEYVRMPRRCTASILGKSTYARVGTSCLATPLEAGWEGNVTLEFANTTPLPSYLYAGEGAVQMLVFESDEECKTSYRDRAGKYQGQTGVTIARI